MHLTKISNQQNLLETIYSICFLLLALVLPWSIAAMQIALGLTATVGIIHVIQLRNLSSLTHPFFLFLLIYVITRIFSVMFAPSPIKSFDAFFHTDWVLLSIPFLVITPLRVEQKQRALRWLLISSAIAALYGCWQTITGIDLIRGRLLPEYNGWHRALGGYNMYLTFAGNQLLAFCLGIGLFLFEPRRSVWKKIYLFILVLLFAGIIATYARSAWLAILAVIPLAILLTRPRWLIYAVPGIIVAAILLGILFPALQERFISIFDLSKNETRLNLWLTSLKMIKTHPFFGIGPGFFKVVFPQYKVPGFYDTISHAHNDYLNLAANSGLLAFFSWMAVWISWFYFSLKKYFIISSYRERGILLGTILAISGIMIAALFQCYYTDLENNIFWWVMAAVGMNEVFRINANELQTEIQ
ncbi:MAG: O-antigen ligase family protein [Calditrichaeota bacterium]|nr:MAG: O-antigen ligase family protein [Calditrichota bacterium]